MFQLPRIRDSLRLQIQLPILSIIIVGALFLLATLSISLRSHLNRQIVEQFIPTALNSASTAANSFILPSVTLCQALASSQLYIDWASNPNGKDGDAQLHQIYERQQEIKKKRHLNSFFFLSLVNNDYYFDSLNNQVVNINDPKDVWVKNLVLSPRDYTINLDNNRGQSPL